MSMMHASVRPPFSESQRKRGGRRRCHQRRSLARNHVFSCACGRRGSTGTSTCGPAVRAISKKRQTILFHGDCLDLLRRMPDNSASLTIASPPYTASVSLTRSLIFIERLHRQPTARPPGSGPDYKTWRQHLLGSWSAAGQQRNVARCFPLDFVVFGLLGQLDGLVLRNRIVWTYGHGVHASRRFSGRHETILWFTKGGDYPFDLDAVREPQKYPGKRMYHGPRKGQFSGNPKGKNPSDVWSIPNVKAKHVEKLRHPCQFPVGLADRLVRALSRRGDLVCDPYMGSGSTGVAAILNGRRFIGAEIKGKYVRIAADRLTLAYQGTVPHRPVERPIFVPGPGLAVARRPDHFAG